MVTLEKPPMEKAERFDTASGTSVTMASMHALSRPDTATPASTMVVLDAPVIPASRYTANTAAHAPAKAEADAHSDAPLTKAVQISAASPAPAFTPMMLGEARRLASTL